MRHLIEFLGARKKVVFLGLGFAGFLALLPAFILGGYQVVEGVDSAAFCTQTCHNVHYAESVTYAAAPHSEVPCSSCHVGEGTQNLVASKIRGLNELVPTITGAYNRPIPTPLKDRRPSSQTCEKCHTADKFFGDLPQIETTYATDAANTKSTLAHVLKVGGGSEAVASGIHWHATGKVWYLALDGKLNQIVWVASQDASGNVTEYVDPNRIGDVTPQLVQQKKQLMDCVDCHNRATHQFKSPDELIDQAISDGTIEGTLPYIKKEAVGALVPQNPSLREADAKIDQIKAYYQSQYPAVYQQKTKEIDEAISQLKEIARLTTFPNNLDWNTYPNEATHDKPNQEMQVDFLAIGLERQSPGCFRCHGTLVKVMDNGSASADQALNGQDLNAVVASVKATRASLSDAGLNPGGSPKWTLSASCDYCHYAPEGIAGGPLAPVIQHPLNGLDDCLVCHNADGPRPFKGDHPWATNAACTTCHQSASVPKPLPAATPPVKAPQTPHSLAKLDDCIACHGPAGAKPVSSNHPWATNDTCGACHKLAPVAKPLPSSPAPVGSQIGHSITGLSACSQCHYTGGPGPFPSDHAGRPDSLCTVCHKVSPSLTLPPPQVLVAPQIPHSIVGLGSCSMCHSPAGTVRYPADHAGRPDSLCTICHKPGR